MQTPEVLQERNEKASPLGRECSRKFQRRVVSKRIKNQKPNQQKQMDESFQIWNGWKLNFDSPLIMMGNSGFKLQVAVKTRSYSANP